MAFRSFSLCVVHILALSLCATASPLRARQNPEQDIDSDEEEKGPDGHLNKPWVVAVAATCVIVIAAVTGIAIFLKWRQYRPRRGEEAYSRTADEVLNAQEPTHDRAWKGPYASYASYGRSPSPPSPAHLSEKDKWAPPTQ